MLVAIGDAARGGLEPLRGLARRIIEREQRFGLVFEPTPEELSINADASSQVAVALAGRYGAEAVRQDRYGKPTAPFDFSVMRRDRRVVSSSGVSGVLAKVPTARFDYIFLDPGYVQDARAWLERRRAALIEPSATEEDDVQTDPSDP